MKRLGSVRVRLLGGQLRVRVLAHHEFHFHAMDSTWERAGKNRRQPWSAECAPVSWPGGPNPSHTNYVSQERRSRCCEDNECWEACVAGTTQPTAFVSPCRTSPLFDPPPPGGRCSACSRRCAPACSATRAEQKRTTGKDRKKKRKIK